MFDHVQAAPPDPILGLTEAFKTDPRPEKINLGVGIYIDDTGKTPILNCVREAEARLLTREQSKSYMPIQGIPEYAASVQRTLFPEQDNELDSGRFLTVHAPGGTGALAIGAALLNELSPSAKVWLSSPTWANHKGIFTRAGLQLAAYPYYNMDSQSLEFDAMMDTLETIPAGDVAVFHVCCHNPTGIDLNEQQWMAVAACAAERGWLPFLDFAYQGFAEGLIEDRAPLDAFITHRVDCFIASSFSKNMGLYSERTGALTAMLSTAPKAAIILSRLKKVIRTIYSNPPAHGGLIAAEILTDPALTRQWIAEVNGMRERIRDMRHQFVKTMRVYCPDRDFTFIDGQKGMFSFCGLTTEQLEWLIKEKSIYAVSSGRINIAAITRANIDYLCQSIAEALTR